MHHADRNSHWELEAMEGTVVPPPSRDTIRQVHKAQALLQHRRVLKRRKILILLLVLTSLTATAIGAMQ